MIRSSTVRILACAVIALAAGAYGYHAGAQENEEPAPLQTLEVNEVARVGKNVITAEEFIQRLVLHEKIYFTDPDKRTATWALDSLLIEEMLELEAERLGARPKAREVIEAKKQLEEHERNEREQNNKIIVERQEARGEPPRPLSWEQWIDRRYGMTTQQYSAHLLNAARKNLRQRMVIYYWADSTDHADAMGIFMQSRNDIDEIRNRALGGEDFGLLAEKNSRDMWTRENRGKIGTVWPQDGSLDKEVDEAFWKLEVGEISPVIKTFYGYWIIKRVQNYPGNEAPFFDCRGEMLDRPNVKDDLMLKWRHALAASERYAFERRMPGWDCEADIR